jgi:hypothetical protein
MSQSALYDWDFSPTKLVTQAVEVSLGKPVRFRNAHVNVGSGLSPDGIQAVSFEGVFVLYEGPMSEESLIRVKADLQMSPVSVGGLEWFEAQEGHANLIVIDGVQYDVYFNWRVTGPNLVRIVPTDRGERWGKIGTDWRDSRAMVRDEVNSVPWRVRL